MSEQYTPEPFGYFKPEPFGWTDCAESDDDAIPLYDKVAIKLIEKQRDELLAALEESRRIVADALAEYGECDHSVGICNCDLKRSIEASDAAIASVKDNTK